MSETRPAANRDVTQPDNVEVCDVLENYLERARRGEFSWVLVVAGDGKHIDTEIRGNDAWGGS